MSEMLTRENASILAERWRDALLQMAVSHESIKDGLFTGDMVHRILGVILEEVVVAEGGKPAAPRSVPYRELEEKLAIARNELTIVENNAHIWSRSRVAVECRQIVSDLAGTNIE